METNINEIEVNGITYVRKGAESVLAPTTDGMGYCVIRTYSAGVHIGYVAQFGSDNNPQYAKLLKSRRLHYWDGAASLSQVAMEGVNSSSRIAMEIPEIELTDVIEVIPCSEEAMKFFQNAKVWKK